MTDRFSPPELLSPDIPYTADIVKIAETFPIQGILVMNWASPIELPSTDVPCTGGDKRSLQQSQGAG